MRVLEIVPLLVGALAFISAWLVASTAKWPHANGVRRAPVLICLPVRLDRREYDPH